LSQFSSDDLDSMKSVYSARCNCCYRLCKCHDCKRCGLKDNNVRDYQRLIKFELQKLWFLYKEKPTETTKINQSREKLSFLYEKLSKLIEAREVK
jgi:hypothetical protein